MTRGPSRTGGLFVPKPSRRIDCQGHIVPDLGAIVRQRPLASSAGGGDCYSLGYSVGVRRLDHCLQNPHSLSRTVHGLGLPLPLVR